jgi:hypothetical protein
MSTIRDVAAVRETRASCDMCGAKHVAADVRHWTDKLETSPGWIKYACAKCRERYTKNTRPKAEA